MSKTIYQFVNETKKQLDDFQLFWCLQNIENPDQYPMKLDNDNDGMWNELFIAYLESNNV
jgi:hypothetical protein